MDTIVREMWDTECYNLVRTEQVGRLACSRDNQPYIVPIRSAHSENSIFSFSMPGKKIEIMRSNPRVCVEIDHLSDTQHWKCVIIEGVFRGLPSKEERQHAWGLHQVRNDWWEPGALKPGPQPLATQRSHLYYKIEIENLMGREAVPA